MAARELDAAFQQMLGKLPRDGSTLLVLTADHGQSDTPAQLAAALHEDARLGEGLNGPPAGENLVRYLNVKPGGEGGVADRLAEVATLLSAPEAWREGLFGGPPAQEEFLERTGDWIAVAHHQRQLLWTHPAKHAQTWAGTHGGWSADLMVVPVLTLRL